MKIIFKTFWWFLSTSIIIAFILVNLLCLAFYGNFWLENEFHPVQYVEEATVYEVIKDKCNVSDNIIFNESNESYSKKMKEYERERPYKLVTKYKDIKIECFGTLDYLKQRKCLDYNKAIQLHKEKIIADEKAELKAEKQAKEIDILNNLECN